MTDTQRLRELLERAGFATLIADTHHTKDYAGREHGFLRNSGELVPVAGFVLRVEGMPQDKGAARLAVCAEAVNELPALLDRIDALEAALRPFAERCDETVRPSDDDGSGVTVRTRHLRAARKLLEA